MFHGADPSGTSPHEADDPSEVWRGPILGFAWVEPAGAFGSAPYLKLIAVHPRARGSGTGSALVDSYEEATRSRGTMWTLLVSDFNLRAQDFYRRHGYRVAGELPGFAVEGITEILMIKPKCRYSQQVEGLSKV
jgi:ribosomal protein S18 acetylase RimI-like enzyme